MAEVLLNQIIEFHGVVQEDAKCFRQALQTIVRQMLRRRVQFDIFVSLACCNLFRSTIVKQEFKSNQSSAKPKRVALVYHYFAHYRIAILREMKAQKPPAPVFDLFAGCKAKVPNLKTISDSGCDADAAGEKVLHWSKLRNWWFGRGFLWQSGVVRLAWSKKYDTVIFLGCMYYISTWVAALLAKFRGKRVLMWTHGTLRHERGMRWVLRRTFYRLADGLLLYNNRSRILLQERGFCGERLYVVYNSLDYAKQRNIREGLSQDYLGYLRQKLFRNPELPVVIFVGRLTAMKRLDLLIKAIVSLNVNCLLVGDGPEKERMTALSQKFGIEHRVCFYGESHREEEVGPLIALADLCVSPGEIGLTAMHALAYGTPIATHDDFDKQGPEFEALIDGKNGFFFRHGDWEDLSERMRSWLQVGAKSEDVRKACVGVIEEFFNPKSQIKIFTAAVEGVPASELRTENAQGDS